MEVWKETEFCVILQGISNICDTLVTHLAISNSFIPWFVDLDFAYDLVCLKIVMQGFTSGMSLSVRSVQEKQMDAS